MKVLCFVGWSGSGKTTLIERLLPRLARDGRRVGYLKTDAHGFTMDIQGKDTARLFDAGAPIVSIIGPDEVAIRMRHPERLALEDLLDLVYTDCDLVLVEGAKRSALPMIEVVMGRPAVPGTPTHLLALVHAEEDARNLPRFGRDDIEGIARFVEDRVLR